MNWLNYHHLYYFWLINKEGNLTKVAKKLNIAQSAVSKQIFLLEESLELPLFDRSNKRNPVLTEEGKKVLEYANTIFEAGEELKHWIKYGSSQKQSTIKIGTLPGLSRNFQYEFLRPILGNESVRIEVVTADQEKLIKLLADHSIDVILSSHGVATEGKIEFKSHVLTSSPLVFVTSHKTYRPKKDFDFFLKNNRIFIPGKSFEARPELDAFFEKMKFDINIAGEIDDIALLRILALRSDEVVAIPQMGIRSEIENKTVKIIKSEIKISQKFYAITRSKKIPNDIVKKLILKFKTSEQ